MQRDKTSEMSPEDMQAQYDAAMELYNMHERSCQIVDSIRPLRRC
jgi:hypothetical protein